MALNTVSSDRLSTNVKTSNLGTELKGKVGQNKNLMINGACLIAQRGTSATTEGYLVDRMEVDFSGTDEAPTISQTDVASGTTPYTSGFRKAFKITNGNQTSGAGAADRLQVFLKQEAQNIVNSGWNYLSSSSNITLSFWIKSSVAQNFFGFLRTRDGTEQRYPFQTGSLSADTWTKITKTIPGNSSITMNNDTGEGLQVTIMAFMGTDYTDSGVSLNAWGAYAGGTQTPDHTSTWYTTNDATLEMTGFQLEVGSVATDFEHRSFGDELLRCQRYYENVKGASYNDGNEVLVANGFNYETSRVIGNFQFKVEKRARPSTSTDDVLEVQVLKTGAAWYSSGGFGGNSNVYCTRLDCTSISTSPLTAGQATEIRLTSDGIIHFDAEL
tara:strand:- start:171 stop:1325 length:1155 start_codon:yes stop_codon:yes gene_type:complete